MDNMGNDILVSCTVVSYNSEKTIVETLESIKSQTYRNIELIVSDDCSKDNTVLVCRGWIEKNKDRFVRTELITVEKNTGVCENCNRVKRACRGEWVKGVAADDILLPNCVADFVEYVKAKPEAMWVSSYIRVYRDYFNEENIVSRNESTDSSFFDMTAEEQLKKIALWNVIKAPSLFINRELGKEVGYYDSTYSFEDYPYYLKILEHGYKCFFLQKETVGYRLHESISHNKGTLFNYKFLQESRRFHREKCFKYLTPRQIKGQFAIWKFQDIIVALNLNKDKPVIRFIYNKLFAILKKIYNN